MAYAAAQRETFASPRQTCACLSEGSHDPELLKLIKQSAETWTHFNGHGDAYAATEDLGYKLPTCDPCYGAVGPYSAVWYCPSRNQYRCSGCLHHELKHGR